MRLWHGLYISIRLWNTAWLSRGLSLAATQADASNTLNRLGKYEQVDSCGCAKLASAVSKQRPNTGYTLRTEYRCITTFNHNLGTDRKSVCVGLGMPYPGPYPQPPRPTPGNGPWNGSISTTLSSTEGINTRINTSTFVQSFSCWFHLQFGLCSCSHAITGGNT